MSIALHGNLRDFGIAEVFQLIGQQRKTGTLVVGEGAGAIFLAFDAGHVVRGGLVRHEGEPEPLGQHLVRAGYVTREQLADLTRESERSARPLGDLLLAAGLVDEDTLEAVRLLLTKETVFDVMRRRNGDFHFRAEPVAHTTKPENLLGAEQILMDGLRMLDEWRTFSSIVPSQDLVFRRVGDLESVRALTRGDSERLAPAERVMQLVDGRLTVRRIIDLSHLGTFEATRALAELRQAGLIDLVAETGRKEARLAGAPRPSVALGPLLRAALATVLPMLLLGGLVAWLAGPLGGTRSLPGSAIPERAWAGLDSRYETRLIRQLVEIHRFETGSHPGRLSELARVAAERSDSLTPERLDAYYYAVRGGEVILLAPMNDS